MKTESYVRVAGALQIALAMAHLFFPKRFNWKEELSRLSLLNRQIFLVHTAFISLMLLMMGSLSLFATETLLRSGRLSRLVLGGFASFWCLRLIFQWFVYDSRLWRGHRFNTLIHFLFTALWLYLAGVYAISLFTQP
jgi:hypothetical protein